MGKCGHFTHSARRLALSRHRYARGYDGEARWGAVKPCHDTFALSGVLSGQKEHWPRYTQALACVRPWENGAGCPDPLIMDVRPIAVPPSNPMRCASSRGGRGVV